MRPAAKMIPFIGCDDRSDSLFTDTRLLDRYTPVWLYTRANWRAIFHALCTFNKSVRAAAIVICVFYENISPCHSSPEIAE
jgi:hypothetical protein